MEVLISKDTHQVPFVLLIRNYTFSFDFENFIRGYHVYMKVWSPLLGECLFDKKKTSNGVGKNAVAMICLNSFRKEEVVGHVPQNISKVVSLYLSPPH